VTSAPDGPRRLARAAQVAIAASVLLNLGLALGLHPPANETVFTHDTNFARGRMSRDSWGPMEAARSHLASGDPRPVYDAILFEQKVKFQYPPTSLLPLEALHRWADSSAPALLNAFTWAAVVVTALATGALLRGGGGERGWVLFALGAGATLLFYPVVKAYSLGQIQAWITALLALLLLAWRHGRRTAAGVLLGLACAVKPHFAIVVVWALLRRERRFAAAAVLTITAVLAVSLPLYGLANHLNYVKALAFMGRHGEAFYPNQSMNGLLNRLVGNGSNLEFLWDRFAPYDPVVFAGTVLTSLAILAIALFGPSAPGARGGEVDLAAILLAAVMASPIAWEHHYGVLAPIDAVLGPRVLRRGNRWPAVLFGLSYLLSANFLAVAQALAPTAWNFLQSYLYFAALIVFALLLAVRRLGGGSAEHDGVDVEP
jgi:alpha-1,2-mannosyltransferase